MADPGPASGSGTDRAVEHTPVFEDVTGNSTASGGAGGVGAGVRASASAGETHTGTTLVFNYVS